MRRCPRSPTQTIGWDEAQSTVLGAYGDFSPRMAAIAGDFFAKGWIDAPVREGQVARRLLASDGAERPPLHPAQLPGQAAGRDDAGA